MVKVRGNPSSTVLYFNDGAPGFVIGAPGFVIGAPGYTMLPKGEVIVGGIVKGSFVDIDADG